MKRKLISLAILTTLIVNCSESTVIVSNKMNSNNIPVVLFDKSLDTKLNGIDGTLPNYNIRCTEIKYLNESSKTISFHSFNNILTTLNSGEKLVEKRVNSTEDIVKGFCRRVATHNNNIDFNFAINPSQKLCVCIYGGSK